MIKGHGECFPTANLYLELKKGHILNKLVQNVIREIKTKCGKTVGGVFKCNQHM